MDMSMVTTKKAWKEREEHARLLAQVVAQQRKIKERLLRYRTDNARPEDAKGMLPQEVAASRADVSTRQWQRWESGERMPHHGNLEKLAENLKIPVSEFYADAPTKTETPGLLDTLNGDMPEQELRAQLDRIEANQAAMKDSLTDLAKAVSLLAASPTAEPEALQQDDRASA